MSRELGFEKKKMITKVLDMHENNNQILPKHTKTTTIKYKNCGQEREREGGGGGGDIFDLVLVVKDMWS